MFFFTLLLPTCLLSTTPSPSIGPMNLPPLPAKEIPASPLPTTWSTHRQLLVNDNPFAKEFQADTRLSYYGWESFSAFAFEDGSYWINQICTQTNSNKRLPCFTKFASNGSMLFQRVWGEAGEAVYSWGDVRKYNEDFLYMGLNQLQGTQQTRIILLRVASTDGQITHTVVSNDADRTLTNIYFYNNQDLFVLGHNGTSYAWWRQSLGNLGDQRARIYKGMAGFGETGRGVYYAANGRQYFFFKHPTDNQCRILRIGPVAGDVISYKEITCSGFGCPRCLDVVGYREDLIFLLVFSGNRFTPDSYQMLVTSTDLNTLKSTYHVIESNNRDLYLLTVNNQTVVALLDRSNHLLEIRYLQGASNDLIIRSTARYHYPSAIQPNMRLFAAQSGANRSLLLTLRDSVQQKSVLVQVDAIEAQPFTYCDLSESVTTTLSNGAGFGLNSLTNPRVENAGSFFYDNSFLVLAQAYGVSDYSYCAPSTAPTAPSRTPTLPGGTIPPTTNSLAPTLFPTPLTARPTMFPTESSFGPTTQTAYPSIPPTFSPTLFNFSPKQIYVRSSSGRDWLTGRSFLGNSRLLWVNNKKQGAFYILTNQTGYPLASGRVALKGTDLITPYATSAWNGGNQSVVFSLSITKGSRRLGCLLLLNSSFIKSYAGCFEGKITHHIAVWLRANQGVFSTDLKINGAYYLLVAKWHPADLSADKSSNLTIRTSRAHRFVMNHALQAAPQGNLYYGLANLLLEESNRQIIWFYGVDTFLKPVFSRYFSSDQESLRLKNHFLRNNNHVWLLAAPPATYNRRTFFIELRSRRYKGVVYELFVPRGKLDLRAVAEGVNQTIFLAGMTNLVGAFGEHALCILAYKRGFAWWWGYAYNTSLLPKTRVFLTPYGKNLSIKASTQYGLLNHFVNLFTGNLSAHKKKPISVRLENLTTDFVFNYYTDPRAVLKANNTLLLRSEPITLREKAQQLHINPSSALTTNKKSDQNTFSAWEIVLISFGALVGGLLLWGLGRGILYLRAQKEAAKKTHAALEMVQKRQKKQVKAPLPSFSVSANRPTERTA